MSLGESLSSGPFFKAYVVNLFPGQFVQPFIDAAFSDLGVDPATLLPSQLTDPPTGQPGTPALPVPYPRTGQGGEPRLHLPDAITGKPGDPRYPYRNRPRPHRLAARRRGRLRCRHPSWPPRPSRPHRRSTCRHQARRRPSSNPEDDHDEVAANRPRRPGDGTGAGVVCGPVRRVPHAGTDRPNDGSGLLREQHRGVRRRPRAHSRRAGRQDRSDRTAARAGQDHDLVRQQVQGPCRCQGRDPGTAAGNRPDNPAHTALHRRTDDGRRRGDPRRPHRGACRMGRPTRPTRAADGPAQARPSPVA